MSDLPDEGSESNQLPAKDLCNSWGTGNPILGKGALGNEKTGKMYYQGRDKKKLVEIAQMMLNELGHDLGTSGPNRDGIDGIFGNNTEKAVKEFQEGYKNWDSNKLKIDGLIGPQTSDALNREMVGRWYHHYQTPKELVGNKPYHAVTSEYLKRGQILMTEGVEKGKVFIFNLIGRRSTRISGPAFLLHWNATISCPHAGQISIIGPINQRVFVSGMNVAVMGDNFAVNFCNFQEPCISVQWLKPSSRVSIYGRPAILYDSIGQCMNAHITINGFASIIAIQQRVLGI